MKKQLPVVYPPMTSYVGHADALAVLYAHPEAHDWIYSQFVQFYATQIIVDDFNDFYPTEGYAPNFFNDFDNRRIANCMSDNIFLDREKCPLLNIFEVPNDLISAYDSSFVNYIKRNIDMGMYTFGYADVSKIREYGFSEPTELSFHQVFIYGYDDETQMFDFADFLGASKYTFSKCTYSEIEEAYKGIRRYFLPRVKSIVSLQYEVNPSFVFDFTNIQDSVYQYLNPDKKTAERFEKYTTGYFKPLRWHTKAYLGVDAYTFLKDFLDLQLQVGITRLDLKPYHAMYDHKHMMVQRIEHFIKTNRMAESKQASLHEYEQVRERSKEVRNLIIKYNVKPDSGTLSRAKTLLDEIKAAEAPLLAKLFDL